MSRDYRRTGFYDRNKERDRDWDLRGSYNRERTNRSDMSGRRSRSLSPAGFEKCRTRTPRSDKDMIDDNILNEISKLPEPSELWDPNQFQESVHTAPLLTPSFLREQPNQSYGSNYQLPYSGIYDEFSATASSQHPSDMTSCTALTKPLLPEQSTGIPEEQNMVLVKVPTESEKRHRKAILSKQKEDHINKATLLRKELETLRDQRNELRGDGQRSLSPDTKRFLKDNTKLQLEIQNKLKTINNIVEMINGITDDEQQEPAGSEEPPIARSAQVSQGYNYVYYDPELHWCRVCNEFPPTAKDYLNHLHSPSHYETAAQHMEAPWHSVPGANEGFPPVPSAPTKRTPIRGLQFFVPQTGWYCKLCDQFIGDLHCASAHLKSIVHSRNYNYFVQQNPHWETDWMSDRQRAFERPKHAPLAAPSPAAVSAKPAAADDKSSCTVQYTSHTVTVSKEEYNANKTAEKKTNRKKRDSSVSSDSSEGARSAAIGKRLRTIVVPDDESLEELISLNDRKLLENIKSRMKKNLEAREKSKSREKGRVLEMQRKIKESERRGLKPRQEEGRRGSRDRRDKRANSRDKRDTAISSVKRTSSRDRRVGSRDRRAGSRDRRAGSRDRRAASRDRSQRQREREVRSPVGRDESRDRRDKSRSPDRRDVKPERRNDKEDRQDDNPGRWDVKPDRQDDKPDRRDDKPGRWDDTPGRWDDKPDRWDDKPDRRDDKPDRRDDKPDIKRMIVIGKMPFFKSQSDEQKKEEQKKKEEEALAATQERMQKLLPAIALSAALQNVPLPPLPPPVISQPALPAPGIAAAAVAMSASTPAAAAPLLVPTPQLPIPLSNLPMNPQDFQKALEEMFPTDPKKCAEKVEQELRNQAMQQQPSILGAPPPELLGLSPFAPLMRPRAPMYGFDPMFPPPISRPLLNQRPPSMPNRNIPRHNPQFKNKPRNQQNTPRKNLTAKQKKEIDARTKKMEAVTREMDAKIKQLDELALLGIDASDVVA